MPNNMIQAPASLLLHPHLTPAAKLLWLVLRLSGPANLAALEARTGISRPTLIKARAQLASAGWGQPPPRDRSALIPMELLTDRRVGVQSRLLYGVLQCMPEYSSQAGQFTFSSVSALAHVGANTLRRAAAELVRTGWLRIKPGKHQSPIEFTLSNPVLEREEADLNRAKRRLEEAPYHGEALMKEFLSLLVDSEHYEDNATPGFLVNPLTNQRMELDRFYPPNVAFEFQGAQHYSPTDFKSPEQVAEQQSRDLMKHALCIRHGVTLHLIHPEDLSLEALSQKVGTSLPLRDRANYTRLAGYLDRIGRRYRRAAGETKA